MSVLMMAMAAGAFGDAGKEAVREVFAPKEGWAYRVPCDCGSQRWIAGERCAACGCPVGGEP